MLTTKKIKELRTETPTPRYLLAPPFLIALGYIILSLLLTEYLSGNNAIFVKGLIITPLMTLIILYSTIGAVNELAGYAGEVSYRSGQSFNKVLPASKTKKIRYNSMALLIGSVMVSILEFTLPNIFWFSLLIAMAILLFLTTLKGAQGHYRYRQFIPKY
jgi:fatty-acid desaturase